TSVQVRGGVPGGGGRRETSTLPTRPDSTSSVSRVETVKRPDDSHTSLTERVRSSAGRGARRSVPWVGCPRHGNQARGVCLSHSPAGGRFLPDGVSAGVNAASNSSSSQSTASPPSTEEALTG